MGVGGMTGSGGGSGSTHPSTMMWATSGAAWRMASSTAIFSVTAEDGQPSQLPSRRMVMAPASSSTSSTSTSPPWDARYGRTESRATSMRDASSKGCSPCSTSRLCTNPFLTTLSRSTTSPESTISSMTLFRPAPYRSVTSRMHSSARWRAVGSSIRSSSRRCSRRSPTFCEVLRTHPSYDVGECILRRTLPLPRYMWTPHGRQGSKLRTARMMSMPLKFSRSFSSKIGVFITASS